jgi:hypothetical protein
MLGFSATVLPSRTIFEFLDANSDTLLRITIHLTAPNKWMTWMSDQRLQFASRLCQSGLTNSHNRGIS